MNIKQLASKYIKIVEWSEEDGCFVGRCPELFGGGCHGDNEIKVYTELSAMVEEAVADLIAEKAKLPTPASTQKFSGKFVLRTGSDLHKALSIRAEREGKSINQVVLDSVRSATVAVNIPYKLKKPTVYSPARKKLKTA